MTVDLEACADHLYGTGLATRTVRAYLLVIRRVDAWCEARRLELAELSATELRRLVDGHWPRSYASRRQLRAALGHYWAHVGRPAPPLRAVPVPQRPDLVCRALEPGEAAALDSRARQRGDAAGLAVLLGLYLGLRREEIAQLRWGDFAPGLTSVTVTGKGGRVGTLPVHPVLAEALGAFRGVDTADPSWIFPGRFGTGANPATIWSWVRDVAGEAGLTAVPPHRLRHTCLATANDATGDLRAVQAYARHSRPETTAGYTRATAKRLHQVMLSLDYQAGAIEATSA